MGEARSLEAELGLDARGARLGGLLEEAQEPRGLAGSARRQALVGLARPRLGYDALAALERPEGFLSGLLLR